MEAPRLPRQVEDDPHAANLSRELAKRGRLLWPGGRLRVAQVEWGTDLDGPIRSAFTARRIVRGLESAERVLSAEARGLKRVDRKTQVARGARVSRLLLVADDGAERFYRRVESLVEKYSPRVLALRLSVDQNVLGQHIYGPDQVARLVLIEHKEAVSAILLGLAARWAHQSRRGESGGGGTGSGRSR